MTTRPAAPEPLTAADEAALRRTIDQMRSDDWADSYRYHPRTIAMLFDTLDREREARADERALILDPPKLAAALRAIRYPPTRTIAGSASGASWREWDYDAYAARIIAQLAGDPPS